MNCIFLTGKIVGLPKHFASDGTKRVPEYRFELEHVHYPRGQMTTTTYPVVALGKLADRMASECPADSTLLLKGKFFVQPEPAVVVDEFERTHSD